MLCRRCILESSSTSIRKKNETLIKENLLTVHGVAFIFYFFILFIYLYLFVFHFGFGVEPVHVRHARIISNQIRESVSVVVLGTNPDLQPTAF